MSVGLGVELDAIAHLPVGRQSVVVAAQAAYNHGLPFTGDTLPTSLTDERPLRREGVPALRLLDDISP